MCLAVPGRIQEVRPAETDGTPAPLAIVDFQGSRLEVSLLMTPEARPGDWVLVHAGFALQRLDPEEAREIWEYLEPDDVTGALPRDPGQAAGPQDEAGQ